MSLVARLCRRLEAHRWAVSAVNILSAALFVVGSVGFFWSGLFVTSVSLFLAGSLLYLCSALAGALLEHGPTGKSPDDRTANLRNDASATAKSQADAKDLVARVVTADDLDAVEADTEVRGNELSNGLVGFVVHRSCVDSHDESAISGVVDRVSASSWDHTYLEAPVVRAQQPRP